MRRQRRSENGFIWLILNSLGALLGITGSTFVFVRAFGEMAIPAIDLMGCFMYLPIITLLIGIVGWIWSWNSNS